MKKAAGFISVTLVFMLLFCACETSDLNDAKNDSKSLSEQLILEIDGAYSKESELPEFSTTAGMIELADKYTEKWKQVAEDYYQKIMKYEGIVPGDANGYSSDDLHNYVSRMKTNWERYSYEQCQYYIKSMQAVYSGGTMVGPIGAIYKYEMQKEWALELVAIYEQLVFE